MVAPQLGVEELALLQAADPPPIHRLLTAVLNDASALPTDVELVLDDYHVIESREVHEAMAFLLDHAPPRLHLVPPARLQDTVPRSTTPPPPPPPQARLYSTTAPRC